MSVAGLCVALVVLGGHDDGRYAVGIIGPTGAVPLLDTRTLFRQSFSERHENVRKKRVAGDIR